MANTIAGVNLAQIAQESLPALQTAFAPLAALTTDFSADIQGAGESVTTRYPTKPVAKDMSAGYKTAASDVAMTAAKIDLDSHRGFTYGFNDVERSKSSINLNDLFIEPALQAVGANVFNSIWDLITAANFSSETTITLANYDRDTLIDVRTILTETLKAPAMGRSVIHNPAYYGGILKSLNSAEIPGITEEKREGIAPRVAKFDLFETDLADDNSEDLAAFALHRSALLMAARTVDTELAANAGIEVETVVVPDLGLPVQFRRWYDSDGILYYNMNILYGVAKGTPMGVRIKSA